ncbi:LutC/YkgG family protein [Corynebacterium caspium]|uniref:LutC/YkgG family protein n=1 Tax=Corynebacterium caspium TaxID=234828 RepID=UPI000375686C|nr:LUD domain-containing protein [Corynebacterium caspium]WKD59708.1 Lactate utilization protein C [Corynebacterium caspium DSM 44850]
MSAKSVILSRIRSAQQIAGIDTNGVEIPRKYHRSSDMKRDDLRELLIDRLVDYKAHVIRSTTAELPQAIADILADREAGTIVRAPGVAAELTENAAANGVEILVDDTAKDPRYLNTVDGVITWSTVSCAQTGTICLQAGESNGRRALTLVPDRHVCLVNMDTVVHGIPETLERLSPDSPVTWISGPSATSDIELIRVEGVHGPRDLIVIVID